MQLYYGRNSGNSARAMFGIELLGVGYEARLVDPKAGAGAGGNQAPDYLAVNPMGKIPALVDGDLTLWESNAINLYLAERLPQAGLLPATAESRASMHRWLFFQTGHVSPACRPVFLAGHAAMVAYWGAGDEPAAARGRQELARFLPVIEQALEGRDYLERDLTLADVAFVPHLFLVEEAGFDFAPYPRVRAWLHRLLARPAWKRTHQRIFG